MQREFFASPDTHPQTAAHVPVRRLCADGWQRDAVDVLVEAGDRQGLLRDISEVFSKERINVTAVKTLSRGGTARMDFTVELPAGYTIPRVMTLLGEGQGVIKAQRV